MFWSEEENIKISQVEYVALSSNFNGVFEPYLYEYDNNVGHMYKVSYTPGNLSNHLHRYLKFKLQKRFVVVDETLNIIGHYDSQIVHVDDNMKIIDLQKLKLRFL